MSVTQTYPGLKAERLSPPAYHQSERHGELEFVLEGAWTLANATACEALTLQISEVCKHVSVISVDLDGIERMDTSGVWLLDRMANQLKGKGCTVEWQNLREGFSALLSLKPYEALPLPARRTWYDNFFDLLVDTGYSTVQTGRDIIAQIDFFGRIVSAFAYSVKTPKKFRLTSIIYFLEAFGFRSVPIIALINFLVGCIVAQQGIFQLQRFGASTFAVDLIGILVLRELGVLLTSIMVAGRSGSAITAEIGSMRMREEIDALDVMGFDPLQVLVLPRILALVFSLPLLTVVADMSASFGGLLVAWNYAGIAPETFLERLQGAVAVHTFASGIVKAPFMALVIAMISTREGLLVEGSAESLGKHVTSSVVKSIFMVIVVDGMFAMFFASIRF